MSCPAFLRCLLVGWICTAAGACSDRTGSDDDDDSADGDADTDADTDADADGPGCMDACTTKAEECGAPAGQASTACTDLCGSAPTPTQIDCLSSTSCGALIAAFSEGDSVCGIGQGGVDAGSECIPLGSSGCEAGQTSCCVLGAACEVATGICCLPGGTPDCEDGECCSNAECLPDLGDPERTVCREPS